MRIIGLTGKSGSGKSYFANLLSLNLNNCQLINIDSIFSKVMNTDEIISRIYSIYGNKAIKGKEWI